MVAKTGFEALPSFDGWKPDRLANYGGSSRKNGLISPEKARYMVKFAKRLAPRGDLASRHVNNTVSEYMSSHILGILGYPVQETVLGTRNGEVVVVCRNFVPRGSVLLEFERFMRRRYYSHEVGQVPDIEQLYDILETDPDLSPQSDHFKASFWERFVGDALVGNSARHKEDFGYLIDADGSVSVSPVYDNGSTLCPDLSEADMRNVLADPREFTRRVRLFPKAALTMHRKKVGYYDLMASGIYSELTDAVLLTVPRIRASMPAVREFIDGCAFLSDTRKEFYRAMLDERMAFILEPACEKCASGQFDPSLPQTPS